MQFSVMYMQKVGAFICMLIVFSGNALAADKLSGSDSDMPNTYNQSKTTIVVSKKQPVFIIKLASNPTTGFTWLLRDYDKMLLSPLKHEFEPPQKHLIGAPGYEIWTFRAKPEAFTAPHRTEIHMIYARPWEPNKDNKETVFEVTTIDE